MAVGKLYLAFGLVATTNKLLSLASEMSVANIYKKNGMGGACGAYGGWERCAQGSGEET